MGANTVSHFKTERGTSMAQETLLNVTWQPGWEGTLGENGYMYNIWLSCSAVYLELLQHC